MYIEPSKIRFTQDSISGRFSDGRKLNETYEKIVNGKIDYQIPLEAYQDRGHYWTLGNRRL